MEHTYLECLQHGEIILRPATKIKNYINGSLRKRKHISPENFLQIQTKDTPDRDKIIFAIEPKNNPKTSS